MSDLPKDPAVPDPVKKKRKKSETHKSKKRSEKRSEKSKSKKKRQKKKTTKQNVLDPVHQLALMVPPEEELQVNTDPHEAEAETETETTTAAESHHGSTSNLWNGSGSVAQGRIMCVLFFVSFLVQFRITTRF
jgi:outer membrane biosynthesis protein TonB